MRQSRYGNFDRLGFITAVQTVIFEPAHNNLLRLMREVQRAHSRATRTDIGFQYNQRYYPQDFNAPYTKMLPLIGEMHERMEDILKLTAELEEETNTVMHWVRGMTARCNTLAQVKHNLMPELVAVICSDQPVWGLDQLDDDDSVLYPQDRSVQNLQLKYIGLRFIYS